MTTPTPTPAPGPAAVDDGKTLGIVGLVLAFVFPIAGLIVSIIARNKSKAAGVENGLAKAGLILSIIFLVLGVIIAIVYFALFAALIGSATVVTY